MIRHLNRRIREIKATNVTTILADPDDPLLPESIGESLFHLRRWHHVENQTKYLASLKKMLKPGGEIVLIDFHKKELPFGPPHANENRPRGLDQANGEQRVSLDKGAYVPAATNISLVFAVK